MSNSSMSRHPGSLLVAALLAAAPALAGESVPQPAESAREQQERATTQPPADAPRAEHARSWEAAPLGETTVQGERPLSEEDRIGAYSQPRWTAHRRFPTTRVYVVPEGTAQFEWWLNTKTPLNDPEDTRFRSLFEFEFGLGHRLQLDLYLQTEQQGTGTWDLVAELVELRYAFADWGVLPGNPTLYLEWVRQHEGVHKGEVKLLLGGEMAPRWHWGANLVFERELGGSTQGHEYALTGAVSYTLQDAHFSVGGEVQVELTDVRGRRFDFDGYELLLGPSIQWRPVKMAHVDLVALVGPGIERAGEGSPFETSFLIEPTLVFGWEL